MSQCVLGSCMGDLWFHISIGCPQQTFEGWKMTRAPGEARARQLKPTKPSLGLVDTMITFFYLDQPTLALGPWWPPGVFEMSQENIHSLLLQLAWPTATWRKPLSSSAAPASCWGFRPLSPLISSLSWLFPAFLGFYFSDLFFFLKLGDHHCHLWPPDGTSTSCVLSLQICLHF